MAPKTAMPRALPIERANMLVPVTTPRSRPVDRRLGRDQGRAGGQAQAEADHEAGRRQLPDRALRRDQAEHAPRRRPGSPPPISAVAAEADPQVDPAGDGRGDAASRGSARRARTRRPGRWCRARPGRRAGCRRSGRSASRRRPATDRLVAFSSRLRKIQPGSTGSAARRSTSGEGDQQRRRTADQDARLGGEDQAQETPPSSSAEDQQRAARGQQPGAGQVELRCRFRSTCSWNWRTSAQAATAPSGMLTKKIQRQSRKSTNSPPRVGPDHRRDGPDAGHVALDLGPLLDGVDVADDGHRRRLDRAGAQSLQRPEGDQRRHAPGEAAEDRAER